MQRERRNISHIGEKRRRDFDRSAKQLYDLGLSPWAVEYFRRAARVSGVLPHMVVCQVAMMAAGRMLSKSTEAAVERESANEPAPSGRAHAVGTAPSYLVVCAKRNQVQSLWREIQRHESASSIPGARADDRAAPDPDEPAPDARALLAEPTGNGPKAGDEWNKGHARSPKRGRAPSKHH